MDSAYFITKADELVDAWVKVWTKEKRLDGGLDRVARKDLVDRVALALSEAHDETKPGKKAGKAKAGANG